MKIGFFEIEGWEAEYVKAQIANRKLPIDASFSADKLAGDRSGNVDAISVFVGSSVTRDTLDRFPNLKLITTRSTGFDHIDIAAARGRGIAVGYAPGYGDNTVAEFTFGLILTLSRKIYESFDRIRETRNFSLDGLRGFDLCRKTIGVLGAGRIGQSVIRIARGFDMEVLAYDSLPKEESAQELGFRYVAFDDLLTQSDIITIHVPHNESTHHLINKENIGKIKRGALLINTSRGGIAETEALVRALHEGILGGVGLDVLEEEDVFHDEEQILFRGHPEDHDLRTVLANHILIDMPNVVMTPHNAFNTKEALERILLTDIENISAFHGAGAPKYSVPEK
ncbi:hydroxyacid dehydrogenase [Candidatus Wolfebacteria bacterium]|nr:hydroxyacid dehydrogenase [Candidatus Wolfebacteria bacterium]